MIFYQLPRRSEIWLKHHETNLTRQSEDGRTRKWWDFNGANFRRLYAILRHFRLIEGALMIIKAFLILCIVIRHSTASTLAVPEAGKLQSLCFLTDVRQQGQGWYGRVPKMERKKVWGKGWWEELLQLQDLPPGATDWSGWTDWPWWQRLCCLQRCPPNSGCCLWCCWNRWFSLSSSWRRGRLKEPQFQRKKSRCLRVSSQLRRTPK